MKRRGAFTLVELVFVIVIIGVLAATALGSYVYFLEKAKSAEALINISAVRKGEEIHKAETGNYVAASNAEEINRALSTDIIARFYEYEVTGVTDSDFIVIARRIGLGLDDYLSLGTLIGTSVIAMDRSGALQTGYGTSPGGGTIGGGTTTGGTGGSGWGGSTGGGVGSTGGGGGSTGGGGTTGGGTDIGYPSYTEGGTVTYNSTIENSMNLLSTSTTGKFYYDLLIEKNITIIFGNTGSANAVTWIWFPARIVDRIVVSESLRTTWPESAIAAVICHEATHVDYCYEPQKWIDDTQERHPEVPLSDIHILKPGPSGEYDSIDQEYMCFSSEAKTWNELKGSTVCAVEDSILALYYQGEAKMKEQIRVDYKDQELTEY